MSSADEIATVLHIAQIFGEGVAYEIAEDLDISFYDMRWVTPAGIDVTDLCNQSLTGGFASVRWTLRGWLLDQPSLAALMAEFPDAIWGPLSAHP